MSSELHMYGIFKHLLFMSLCVCLCVCAHLCVCTRVRVHTRTHTSVRVCMCAQACVFTCLWRPDMGMRAPGAGVTCG